MHPERVETITVDSYSTLVDIGSQETVLSEYIDGDDAPSVSQLWRSQYILYSVISNDIDEYRPFWELIGQGLDYALESHGYDLSEDVRDEIRSTVYEDQLVVFDDVTDGVRRLTDVGYDVYVLSNGNPAMLDHLVEAADLDDIITETISADDARTYKPDTGIYTHAADRTGTPIDRMLHASGGNMRDVWGAKHAGMQTAWVSRPDASYPREHLGQSPDLVVEDFHDLADHFE